MQGARPPLHSQSHTWLLEAQARCYVPQGDVGFLPRCVPSDSPDGNASGGDSALTCCDSDTVVFLHGERHKCHPDQVSQPPPGYLPSRFRSLQTTFLGNTISLQGQGKWVSMRGAEHGSDISVSDIQPCPTATSDGAPATSK